MKTGKNAEKNKAAGQDTLFDVWRLHAVFTTVDTQTMDTVTADKTHRRHAMIEQVNADLKDSALAHLPFGCPFTTWSLSKLVEYLAEHKHIAISTESVRQILRNAGIRCRQPRPGRPARTRTSPRRWAASSTCTTIRQPTET